MTELNYQKELDALQNRNYEDAVNHFTNSLKVNKSIGAFGNRAFAYLKLGKNELAKNDLEASVDMIIDALNKADKNDKKHIDLCLRDLIIKKDTIEYLETKEGNFSIAENLNTQLINLYMSMSDPSILMKDQHISKFYNNRGYARLNLKNIDGATRDMSAAYVESINEKYREEILVFAEHIGLLEEVKKNIVVYSFLKKGQQLNKTKNSGESRPM